MKYMRKTAGNTWTDYKTNTAIVKYLNRTKYNPSFGQNTGIHKKMVATCEQNVFE